MTFSENSNFLRIYKKCAPFIFVQRYENKFRSFFISGQRPTLNLNLIDSTTFAFLYEKINFKEPGSTNF